MNGRARAILWLDGSAGGFVGVLMLGVHDWLARFYHLSHTFILFIAVMNLVYASYSLLLAILVSQGRTVSQRAIEILVTGNLAWTVVCTVMVLQNHRTASVFGVAHMVLEGAFVAVLAALEVRYVRPCAKQVVG